ncbi:MAG: ABC transporter ATP-binding protein [Terriglobia bacterium]
MPSNSPAIRFQDVHQVFRLLRTHTRSLRGALIEFFRRSRLTDNFEALKGVSFTVAEGETLGIIGRNGSGKSTILKIIARIFPPTSGCVEVHGRLSPLIELGAGFHPELTGRENVILGGVLQGFTRKQMREKFERILAFAELEDFIDAPLRQYSTGMYARLGFAVATEIDPDILLVDEILAVGDEAFQQKCLERMAEFRRRRKAMVFVSHSMEQVRELCSRVLLLHDGQVLACGEPQAVIDRYHELLQPPHR